MSNAIVSETIMSLDPQDATEYDWPMPPCKLFSVAVYLVDKSFGGPEEGGWWYTYGDLSVEHQQFTRTFKFEQQALDYYNRLDRVLIRRLNKGRRSIGSVLSQGEYRAEVNEGLPPAHFPEVKPHYE